MGNVDDGEDEVDEAKREGDAKEGENAVQHPRAQQHRLVVL